MAIRVMPALRPRPEDPPPAGPTLADLEAEVRQVQATLARTTDVEAAVQLQERLRVLEARRQALVLVESNTVEQGKAAAEKAKTERVAGRRELGLTLQQVQERVVALEAEDRRLLAELALIEADLKALRARCQRELGVSAPAAETLVFELPEAAALRARWVPLARRQGEIVQELTRLRSLLEPTDTPA